MLDLPRKSKNRSKILNASPLRYTYRYKDRALKRCVEFLKPIEQGKYDRDGRLRRETLADDVKPWTVDIGRPTRYKIRIPARPGRVLG